LDIRTENEFQSGAIPSAVSLDFYASDFFEELKKLDKNKTYLMYCRSGNRSKGALKMMDELEFKEVYELDGGIISFK
jgi:rhodanese-related sulfurtransferase